MKKNLYLLVFLLPLFYCGTCNHEEVDGEIKMITEEISVGDTLELEAIIYDADKVLEEIMWDVDPYEDAKIISPIYEDGDSTQYKALFTTDKPGTYRITLSCFYKQTNPTFIDEVEIVVME
jgi:F420-dependent methylenetetrahydromethanopterin dehydrogenase